MKSSIQKTILNITLMLGCLLGSSASHAQFFFLTFERSTPYCIAQSVWKNGQGLSSFTYHQIIGQPENQFLYGDVFVTLRLKSKPGVFWLYQDGGKWQKYGANSTDKAPVAYYSAELQPLMKISVTLPTKKKLPAISNGDWQLYVGYGLRNGESATIQDSYQDMISNSRDQLVWEAGAQNDLRTMCLIVSGVSMNTPDIIPSINSTQ